MKTSNILFFTILFFHLIFFIPLNVEAVDTKITVVINEIVRTDEKRSTNILFKKGEKFFQFIICTSATQSKSLYNYPFSSAFINDINSFLETTNDDLEEVTGESKPIRIMKQLRDEATLRRLIEATGSTNFEIINIQDAISERGYLLAQIESVNNFFNIKNNDNMDSTGDLVDQIVNVIDKEYIPKQNYQYYENNSQNKQILAYDFLSSLYYSSIPYLEKLIRSIFIIVFLILVLILFISYKSLLFYSTIKKAKKDEHSIEDKLKIIVDSTCNQASEQLKKDIKTIHYSQDSSIDKIKKIIKMLIEKTQQQDKEKKNIIDKIESFNKKCNAFLMQHSDSLKNAVSYKSEFDTPENNKYLDILEDNRKKIFDIIKDLIDWDKNQEMIIDLLAKLNKQKVKTPDQLPGKRISTIDNIDSEQHSKLPNRGNSDQLKFSNNLEVTQTLLIFFTKEFKNYYEFYNKNKNDLCIINQIGEPLENTFKTLEATDVNMSFLNSITSRGTIESLKFLNMCGENIIKDISSKGLHIIIPAINHSFNDLKELLGSNDYTDMVVCDKYIDHRFFCDQWEEFINIYYGRYKNSLMQKNSVNLTDDFINSIIEPFWHQLFTFAFRSTRLIETYYKAINNDSRIELLASAYSRISIGFYDFLKKGHDIIPDKIKFGKTVFDPTLHEEADHNFKRGYVLNEWSKKFGEDCVEKVIEPWLPDSIVDVEEWGYCNLEGEKVIKSSVYLAKYYQMKKS